MLRHEVGLSWVPLSLFLRRYCKKLWRWRDVTPPTGTTMPTKLGRTSRAIARHHRSLLWFLVSAALTQSATTSFSSIAITFMTDQLKFDASENAICILILLVFSVPGARLAQMLSRMFNPLKSLKCCLSLWILITSAAAWVLKGRGRQAEAYSFAILWGICIGWLYPTEKAGYCSIIPTGQDAELMGVYIFACQILSWLAFP